MQQYDTPTTELPIVEPQSKTDGVMAEHTKSKFNNLICWQIMYRDMRHLLVVSVTRYSIFFHGSVNLFTETNKYLKFYFLHPHILNLYFFLFFCYYKTTSIVKFSKNKGQLLLDGYRYRRAINLKIFGALGKIIMLVVYVLME